jgi:hypothetical protein
VKGTGFEANFQIEIVLVPEEGQPTPLKNVAPTESEMPTPPLA